MAGNTSESTEVRGTAIQFAARDSSVSIAEINKLYDAAESRNVREQLIYALGRRNAAVVGRQYVPGAQNPGLREGLINEGRRQKRATTLANAGGARGGRLKGNLAARRAGAPASSFRMP